MTRNKIVNGEIIAFTAEEETARDQEEAQAVIDKKAEQDADTARIAAATTKENNKTSGKAKLKAGEALTDAEISALFGD